MSGLIYSSTEVSFCSLKWSTFCVFDFAGACEGFKIKIML